MGYKRGAGALGPVGYNSLHWRAWRWFSVCFFGGDQFYGWWFCLSIPFISVRTDLQLKRDGWRVSDSQLVPEFARSFEKDSSATHTDDVRVWVCVRVCVYVCVRMCAVRMCARVYVCMFVCVYVLMCIYAIMWMGEWDTMWCLWSLLVQ